MPKKTRPPAAPSPYAVRYLAFEAETAVHGVHAVADLLAHLSTSGLEVQGGELEALCNLLRQHAAPLERLWNAATAMEAEAPSRAELAETRAMLERRFANRQPAPEAAPGDQGPPADRPKVVN